MHLIKSTGEISYDIFSASMLYSMRYVASIIKKHKVFISNNDILHLPYRLFNILLPYE